MDLNSSKWAPTTLCLIGSCRSSLTLLEKLCILSFSWGKSLTCRCDGIVSLMYALACAGRSDSSFFFSMSYFLIAKRSSSVSNAPYWSTNSSMASIVFSNSSSRAPSRTSCCRWRSVSLFFEAPTATTTSWTCYYYRSSIDEVYSEGALKANSSSRITAFSSSLMPRMYCVTFFSIKFR